jgi:glycosyltransferase involved in cell wall biosynthesis
MTELRSYGSSLQNRGIKRICILGLEDYAMLTGDSSFGPIGGESVQHVLLAKAWRDMGLEVSVIVYDHGQPRTSMIDGIRVLASFARDGGTRVLRFVHPRLTSVIRAMREAEADVYYQSPAAPWTGVAAYFAKQSGKSSIARIASDSDCQRSQRPARYSQQPVRYRRDRWMFDYGVLNSSLVAAQTERQRELLARHYGVHSEILNIAVELPAAAAPRSKDIDVLWLGNFREVKRPDIALEIARRLPQYRFAFVGGSVPAGQAYFDRIKSEAQALSNLDFIGAVPYSNTGDWFDRSRIHLNTSDYEGFPNTFLQAWIRRVPVVSFYDPDGLIQRRALGRVCSNVDEMCAQLDRLLRDPTECAHIGARALSFAASEFSAHQIAARYLDLLESKAVTPVRAEMVGRRPASRA